MLLTLRHEWLLKSTQKYGLDRLLGACWEFVCSDDFSSIQASFALNLVQNAIRRELIAACRVARELSRQLGGVPNMKQLLFRRDRQFLTKASSLGTGNHF